MCCLSVPLLTFWRHFGSPVSSMKAALFIHGIDQDKTAVEARLRLPWSNGPVEQVNRLKLLNQANVRAWSILLLFSRPPLRPRRRLVLP